MMWCETSAVMPMALQSHLNKSSISLQALSLKRVRFLADAAGADTIVSVVVRGKQRMRRKARRSRVQNWDALLVHRFSQGIFVSRALDLAGPGHARAVA